MEINRKRIEGDFARILGFSSTDVGYTRLSYSKEDKEVRTYLKGELLKIGADYKEDSVGNIRAKFNPDGLKTKSLLIGSHIDTVPNGGKYDGLTGIICSLEVLRTINENNIKLRNPLELIIFAEEEGSNFGVTMIGSKYITRKIRKEDLHNLYNDGGQSAFDYLESQGFNINTENDFPIDEENELGMIELHVEQGGVLDSEDISIGIVELIAGMNSIKVTIKGKSNHAGTTPMKGRKDALLSASEMIYKLSQFLPKYESAVATVGKIQVKPNASNVIADEVVFYIDIRDVVQQNIQIISKNIEQLCYSVASSNNVQCGIEMIGSSEVVNMDEKLVRVLIDQAEKANLSYKIMNSGAVHDNAMLNDIIPTAMIFVPSIEGISHSPYEETKMADIVCGANLLLNTSIRIITKIKEE